MSNELQEILKVLDEDAVDDIVKQSRVKEIINNRQQSIDKIPKLKPVKTRKNISKYEFAAVITKLALYLNSIPSLEDYVDVVSYNGFINPSELAYNLLMKGVFDAIVNRLDYEDVSFSQLKINPQWCALLESYFKRNHEALKEFCYDQLLDN